MRKDWDFYGRSEEIATVRRILDRQRWFFCAISGRRRIGKTSLIKEAFQASLGQKFFYVQIPDADERGVVQAFQDMLEADGLETETARNSVRNFSDMAKAIEIICENGWVVVLDEFQYFHRKGLAPFQSYLQEVVDRLRDTKAGGLIVLGSLHTEMMAILEDRNAPLFNRITDRIEVRHWDFATLFAMAQAHDITDPGQLLFLWTLFEGVPKFYRDSFDHGVLTPALDYRRATLRKLFFEGSSPLRDEAENWFLREFRGRYDTVLQLLARLGSCSHGDLMEEFKRAGTEEEKQLGGYLKLLTDKYRMIEKRQPIFAGKSARKARYGIADNFLTSWLGALSRNVALARVRPVDGPLARADEAMAGIEGFAFEKFCRLATEEYSRKGVGDFALTQLVQGYWNKPDGSDIEIDLVALDEEQRIIRFGSCKRSPEKHDPANFNGHIDRFLATKEGQRFAGWRQQRALYSPTFSAPARAPFLQQGYLCLDITDFRNFLFPEGIRP